MIELWILPSGTRFWNLDYMYHRDNGPAIQWADGGCEWMVKGSYHKSDGPAVEYVSGVRQWWWYGQKVTEYEHMILSHRETLND